MLNASKARCLRLAARPALALMLVAFPMHSATAKGANRRPLPIFLSTDVGAEIDDQWALAHLLTNPRFQVRVIASSHAPAKDVPGITSNTIAATARHIVSERLRLVRAPRVVSGSPEALIDSKTPRNSEAVTALLRESRGFSSRDRLTVLITGAATDVASALLKDASLEQRIRVVAEAFRSYENGDSYNVRNDPAAWRVILNSRVPLIIGHDDVALKPLSLTRDEVKLLTRPLGPVGSWLLRDYDTWYARVTRNFKNPARPDEPPSWPIWDEVVVAHLLGKTRSEVRPRPTLTDDFKLVSSSRVGSVIWITDIQRDAVFTDFKRSISGYAKAQPLVDYPCVTVAIEPNSCWRKSPS